MPNWVVQVGQLLLSLSLLVFLHEWGHYITARIFKTRVEKFYLFFDFLFPFPNLAKFSLFKFKRGDTEWGIGWFPLGGYVKIAGMLDESADKEAMKLPPKPDEFRSKKAWQRLIIILGGIIVNLILGIIICIMCKFVWGDKYIPYDRTTVAVEDSVLLTAGFRSGDRVLDNKWWGELQSKVVFGDITSIKVERDGKQMDIALPEDMIKHIMKNPKASLFETRMPFFVDKVDLKSQNYLSGFEHGDRIVMVDTIPIMYIDEFHAISKSYANKDVNVTVNRKGKLETLGAKINDKGLLNIKPMDPIQLNQLDTNLMPIVHKTYSFGEAIPAGFNWAVNTIQNYVRQFKLIFTPSTGAYKQVRGFGGMASMFSAEWDWESFWKMTGILSLVLAFMNFLPIPMLDGGYMMFILWEMIRGKPPGEKFMTIANNIGFVIVMALLVYANGNDIFRGIASLFS
jgi:regulator of sigma E protease